MPGQFNRCELTGKLYSGMDMAFLFCRGDIVDGNISVISSE